MGRRSAVARGLRASWWRLAGAVATVTIISSQTALAALPPEDPSAAADFEPPAGGREEARVGIQGLVYLELGDDGLGVNVFLQVFNLGRATWTPSNVMVELPPGYESFQTEVDPAKPGFDEVVGRGAVFRGSFAPGQHDTQFRFKIPYSTDGSLSFGMTVPPLVARMRVVSDAAAGLQLDVPGLPEPAIDTDRLGRPILFTEREHAQGDPPFDKLTITLRQIPMPMGGSSWLVAAAIAIMLSGVVVAYRMRRDRVASSDLEQARSRLIDEIAILDDARVEGVIGVSGHERMRRLLLEALGRILARAKP
jgi:hypothetical protein